ncbi:peptidoglycan DD-metalloendopeptidase family protein [Paenibacillus apiarius]|uniref:peptidoglycan DD-metalloendopeptidase family protein n=1 Tax=Paenibacillus apiarius TaxID=46240 RepID=UPI00197D273F|nr:peptidoglycan DD-metalloendopeptidase family protein [Paenibacillus apiarius]MBN3524274.1 peptidoglycan DD-metalloendopeptidase family protein [Paenibacillus apiarius]
MERFNGNRRDNEVGQDSQNRWQQWTAAWRQRLASDTATRWVAKSRKQIVLTVGGLALIASAVWGGTAYVQANTFSFFHVYKNNELVGTISALNDLESFYAKKQDEVQAKHPNAHMQLDMEGIRTVADSGFKAQPATQETLAKLGGMMTAYATGVELKVNGQSIGIVKDEATAEKILQQVKGKFTDKGAKNSQNAKEVKVLSAPVRSVNATKAVSRLESVSFRERVNMEDSNTDPDNLLSPEEAIHKLTTGQKKPVTYKVQKGDTVSSIAKKMNVSIQAIYTNNPSAGEEVLKAGQELDLTEAKPLITVKTVEAYSEYIVTEPQKIVKEDPEMRAGESKVVRKGKQGLKRMSYRLVKDNGMLSNEEWIDQEVVEPAIPEIVIRGTKVVRGEGTGSFDWPVSGATLTSGYGTRWGRMHKGIDMVSSDRSIMAADEGVVVFAGEKSGYGNCIIVNHRNGYKTLYGHLSKIDINVGDIVEKGQDIGVMGNTGNSTGTHLHFEIHKDDEVQNPLKYL